MLTARFVRPSPGQIHTQTALPVQDLVFRYLAILRIFHHDSHPDEHDLAGNEVSHAAWLVQQNARYIEHHLLVSVRHRVSAQAVRLQVQSELRLLLSFN